ncbi:hypothetical protein [Streptomyces sp. H27-H5]|uniref:hypothetical protein n=1 Tax=Streptomyces sp. H27-H5 TaxID=2996460 RepID=UPI00226D41DE|nr:hypothetical protein [Streptomyces sp. H27-H5]MCY0962377.1 hypothetical protein [Streptomyces sp. H27-H5]
MSQSSVQFALAALGVAGTLAAAIMTQILQRRAERERRTADDDRRWHADRFRAFKDLLYKMNEVKRILYSAAAMLPSDVERQRLRELGRTAFTITQASDVPPDTGDVSIFDATSLEIVQEALERAFSLNEEAEHLIAEISILSEGFAPSVAKRMFDFSWDATGAVESTRGTTGEVYEAILAMGPAIDLFESAARIDLDVAKIERPSVLRRMLNARRRRRLFAAEGGGSAHPSTGRQTEPVEGPYSSGVPQPHQPSPNGNGSDRP